MECVVNFRCENANNCNRDFVDKCAKCYASLCKEHITNHHCGDGHPKAPEGDKPWEDNFCEFGGCVSDGENTCEKCNKVICARHSPHYHDEDITGEEETEEDMQQTQHRNLG